MSLTLLSTKFHVPRVRENAVPRPRLTAKLLASVKRPGSFVLLSGPAGFGKTTLLSEFVLAFQDPVAWVSLDDGDNDPIRFWTYLITACQSIRPQVGESALALLQSPQPLPGETIPTILINDLARLEKELVLILDDYHTIQNQAIHSALAFLVDHLPDKLHPVISTRIDPPWPLARLRARDQLVEIRAADLRFTTEEAAAFLGQVMELNLPAADIAALEARTEGWIASLQLAAISMKGRRDVAGFIQAFTGSHVYVAEYLIEEVLARQSEEVKDFLVKTSILGRMSAGLCEAVTEHVRSQALLKDLYQANLFIVPLDDEGRWYRYHQLFLDLLKARLQQALSAEAIAALHRRAADWYARAGMMPEAIEHALATHDFSYAVQLIEKAAMPMILNAYFRTVEDWLQRIPLEYWVGSLQVNMAFAWMYLTRRNFVEAAPYFERLQSLFSAVNEDELDASLSGEWLALRSMLRGMQGNVAESIDLAERALKILPADDAQIRSMTYMGLANLYEQQFDYERATEAMNSIIQHAHAAGDLASEMLGISLLGRMLLQQGELHAVNTITAEAIARIESASSFSPFSATLYGELAQVHYHWHRLDEARLCFSRSVELSVPGGFSDAEIYHHVFLSRLFQMEGDRQASIQEIEQALTGMQTAAPVFVKEEVISQQVSIFLALDQLAGAQAALKEYGFAFEGGFVYPELTPDAGIPHAVGLLYNSALRILLYRAKAKRERQDLQKGIELAELLITGILRCRHLPIVLQTLLLRSQMHMMLGHEQAGLAIVVKALELAEPEEFISAFVEEGGALAEVLTALLKHNSLGTVQPDYVRSILAAFPGTQTPKVAHDKQSALPVRTTKTPAADESLALIEPLTARELEVLQYIAAGDSNQSIADKLVITLSAVKKHTGNIFRKLTVSSRTQAVVRARQLGLLSSE